MSYLCFLLLNITLFLRPQELFPGFPSEVIPGSGVGLYEVAILTALLSNGAVILQQLNSNHLVRRPVNCCVLLLLLSIPLSHLSHLSGESIWLARFNTIEFAKVVLYFLIATAVMNDNKRIELMLTTLSLLIALVGALAIGQFHEFLHLRALEGLDRTIVDHLTGEVTIVHQLRGTGIFNDPNDLAMLLVFGGVIGWYIFSDPSRGFTRALGILGMAMAFYGVYLTKSRGGALALASAVCVFSFAQLSKSKAILLMLTLSPLPIAVFIARGSEDITEGTSQSRIQIWAEGLNLFKQYPLFGSGFRTYADEVGHVAHNSFLHCFSELGFFGGAAFVGAFLASLLGLYRILRDPQHDVEAVHSNRRVAAILAAATGAVVSMLSLSRSYAIPTFLILAVASSVIYCEINRRVDNDEPVPIVPRFDGLFTKQVVQVSFLFIVSLYLFVRVFARWE